MSNNGDNTKFESLIPNIMVEDVNATIAYYAKFLGFQKIMSVPADGDALDWAMVGRDGALLMLQKRKSIVGEYPKFDQQPVGGSLIFYIGVQNIEALYQSLEAQPQVKVYIKFHTTFYGRKEFAIEDCNGYILTFAEDSRK
jgi:lactoylglutathione lyase